MTYKKLLELIKDMSPEQQEMDVVMAVGDEHRIATLVLTVNHNDDEEEGFYAIGQPILN